MRIARASPERFVKYYFIDKYDTVREMIERNILSGKKNERNDFTSIDGKIIFLYALFVEFILSYNYLLFYNDTTFERDFSTNRFQISFNAYFIKGLCMIDWKIKKDLRQSIDTTFNISATNISTS